jgi:hypothetical protein
MNGNNDLATDTSGNNKPIEFTVEEYLHVKFVEQIIDTSSSNQLIDADCGALMVNILII